MIRSIIADFIRRQEAYAAAVLAWVALAFACAAAVSACVNIDSAPLARDGNLVCRYGDAVVFSGGFRIIGNGADELDLKGTWTLCRDDGVKCTLTSTSTP